MNAAKVDVLSVLDDCIAEFEFRSFCDDVTEARAAVAELIEAAEEARQLLEMLLMVGDREPEPGSTGYKLRAALARIGGAA